jgi:hypothetical protein
MILIAVLICWFGQVFPELNDRFSTAQWLIVCLVAMGLERDW